jgi:type IV pilus assembly protein PilQ
MDGSLGTEVKSTTMDVITKKLRIKNDRHVATLLTKWVIGGFVLMFVLSTGCSRDRRFSFFPIKKPRHSSTAQTQTISPHKTTLSAQAATRTPPNTTGQPTATPVFNASTTMEPVNTNLSENVYVAPPQQATAPMGVMTPWTSSTNIPQSDQVQHAQSVEIRPEQNYSPEPLPPTSETIRVPIQEDAAASNKFQLSIANDHVSLTARDAPLDAVLSMISEQQGLNIVSSEAIGESITVKLSKVPLSAALNAILSSSGYSWTMQGNIIIVSKISGDKKTSPASQGRMIRVFTLNFTAADDVDKIVQGLLSPVGQSFITSTVTNDSRRAHEQLVVEDLVDSVRRIESYIREIDIPPRQVMIEAHVLQIALKDTNRHGVNLRQLFSLAGADVTLETSGLTAGTPPMSLFQISGTDLTAVIEALKSTTDSKTLASPKVAVLNGQEARMQVGGKIGYLMTTTTQTSTLQSVNFLEVGVILKVTPYISDDGQIMIQVNPSVSTGRINPTTTLPESDTTEVQTQVLLGDGEAIVIGGLIKETDIESQNKVPFLGNLWLVGRLFQKSEVTRERNEIIVTLLPRIIPNNAGCRNFNELEIQQAHTPLLYGDLQEMDRSAFEPKLPTCSVLPHDRPTYAPPVVLHHSPGPANESFTPRGVWIHPNAETSYELSPAVGFPRSNIPAAGPAVGTEVQQRQTIQQAAYPVFR